MKLRYRGYTIEIKNEVAASLGTNFNLSGHVLEFNVTDWDGDEIYSEYGYADFEACLSDAKAVVDGMPDHTDDDLMRLVEF